MNQVETPETKPKRHAIYCESYPDILRMKSDEDPTFIATNAEIAELFGCSVSGVHKWRHDHSDFEASVQYAKDAADDRLEESAYARARGQAKTTTVKIIDRPDGTRVTEKIQTTLPPDPLLTKFILTNRRPTKWREKIETKVTGDFSITFDEQDEGVL